MESKPSNSAIESPTFIEAEYQIAEIVIRTLAWAEIDPVDV